MDPIETSPRAMAATPAFATTHWSVVLAAGDSGSPAAQAALENLCRTYWFPVYTFVRRHGRSAADAEDLTQEFFARLLARGTIRAADPIRGRFRAFLLASLRNFLANEWDKTRARKRGEGRSHVRFEDLGFREQEVMDGNSDAAPDVCYERSWGQTLLARVSRRLREESEAAGGTERHDLYEQFLPGGAGDLTYAELGRRLGLTETAVRSGVHRFRARFRALLRREIAHTVATSEEIDEEIRYLMTVMGG